MVNIGIKLYDNTIHPVGNIESPKGAETTITTIVDYQKKAEIEVLINQPEYSNEYFPIGKLFLHNLPLMKAGEPRIIFTFYLDADSALTIGIADEAAFKKKVKIKKENWDPGIGLVKQPGREIKAGSDTYFSIDLSVKEESIKKEPIIPVFNRPVFNQPEKIRSEETGDKEEIQRAERKDTLIPVLIIISLLVLIFSAAVFFFVIRPWEMTTTTIPEPTQAVPTQVTLAATPITTAITEEGQESGTRMQEPQVTPSPAPKKPAIDIISINKVLKEIGPIYFLPNSPVISDPAEMKKIDRIALNFKTLNLKDYKADILVVIQGHTTKAGTENERQTLSGERALTVRDQLIARGAMSKEYYRIEGLGATRPATTEMIKKGYLNRRVELSVESKR
ncbi:MAG: OmpA family protein [Spirochaetales bacterium]|nr:OmpA family protein [Spirochaetales bacterium]